MRRTLARKQLRRDSYATAGNALATHQRPSSDPNKESNKRFNERFLRVTILRFARLGKVELQVSGSVDAFSAANRKSTSPENALKTQPAPEGAGCPLPP
jgi:hypothetical protein